MNLLFISAQPYPEGMAGSKRIRLFAEHLAAKHSVKVIVTGSGNGKNPEKGTQKGVDFEFIRYSRLKSITGIRKAKKILARHRAEKNRNVLLLYDGIGLTNLWFAKQGRRLGYRIATDVVEDYNLHEENAGFMLSTLHKINARVEKHSYQLADGMIVLSTRLKEKFIKLRMQPSRIELVPVSAENVNADVSDPVAKDVFVFVYSGSYGNKDGVEVLIEAFRRLRAKNEKVSLLLAGKINQRIAELIKNDPSIRYAGLVPDREYYNFLGSADALLMTRVNSPYANAGFPFKLGEYLATGRPVIASKVSDVELYLRDKEDALLVEGSDVNSLLKAMEFAIADRDRMKVIGLNGKKKCRQFFDPEKNGKQLEAFLESL